MKNNHLVMSKLAEFDMNDEVVFYYKKRPFPVSKNTFEVDCALVLFAGGSAPTTIGDVINTISNCGYACSEDEGCCEDYNVAISKLQDWYDDSEGFDSLLEIDSIEKDKRNGIVTIVLKDYDEKVEIVEDVKLVFEDGCEKKEEFQSKMRDLCSSYGVELISM